MNVHSDIFRHSRHSDEWGGLTMFATLGFVELFLILVVWLIPLLVVGWLLSLANRAVRALESIAESLRHNKQSS